MTQALLKAAPHKWGEGKIHILSDDRLRTLCGVIREQCPGEVIASFNAEPDCLRCKKAVETQERQAEYQRQVEERERQWEIEKERRQSEYNYYLRYSPEWRRRRTLVLARASGICEGCRTAPATEVHHLTYERIFREMLFDLVAICESCHRELRR